MTHKNKILLNLAGKTSIFSCKGMECYGVNKGKQKVKA